MIWNQNLLPSMDYQYRAEPFIILTAPFKQTLTLDYQRRAEPYVAPPKPAGTVQISLGDGFYV